MVPLSIKIFFLLLVMSLIIFFSNFRNVVINFPVIIWSGSSYLLESFTYVQKTSLGQSFIYVLSKFSYSFRNLFIP